MVLGPRTPRSARQAFLERDAARLAEFDTQHRPPLPDQPMPHLDVAHHVQSWRGVPGGDVVQVRHVQTVPLGRSGRKISYYWAHHMDWVGKGATAHVLSHLFSASVANSLPKLRFIPGQEGKALKSVASDAYHFMRASGFGCTGAHPVFAQGLMQLVAVEHGGSRPSHVRVHYLNFAGMPLFVHRGSDPLGSRLDWFNPGQGVPSDLPNLGLFLKDHPRSYRPRVLDLGHHDALVSYSDGVEEARDRKRRFFGPHLLSQASSWDFKEAAGFIARFKSSLRYFMRGSPHPVEDASVLVVRHAP
ncbi:SpoIIE family protein phosphatase [Candidatus Micrarchaeota archaeon]|nr:SpoIIE family protein phosphatase [Candidatus Micrarchaeota archaeon]